MSFISRAVVFALLVPIRLYRALLSPLLPRLCRFHPSCSVYAMGALQVHGPLKGSWLAVRRLSRCHPFHPGGLDPVPPVSVESPRPDVVAAEPSAQKAS